MPKTTAPFTVLTRGSARDQIFGQTNGTVTVVREHVGTYRVDLQNQEGGRPVETAVATAQGASAVCDASPSVTIPGNDAQTLLVTCTSFSGQRVDTGFQLQYATLQ